MDNKIHIALIVLVKLDKMVATAERPDSLVDTTGVFYLTVAVKFGYKVLSLTVNLHFLSDKGLEATLILTNPHTGGHIAENMLVECMKVNLGEFAEIEDAHTATNVNTYYIGNYLVSEVAGEPYDATGTGVYVGHDAYFLI